MRFLILLFSLFSFGVQAGEVRNIYINAGHDDWEQLEDDIELLSSHWLFL